jgi:hypothetical protein
MSQIFVSYSRRDGEAVGRLVEAVKQDGHQVFFDQDISGGQQWRETIVTAIRKADVFMVVLSPVSIASDHVRKELDIAQDEKKPIVPVVIEQAAISAKMVCQLAGLQSIDLAPDARAGYRSVKEALRAA